MSRHSHEHKVGEEGKELQVVMVGLASHLDQVGTMACAVGKTEE